MGSLAQFGFAQQKKQPPEFDGQLLLNASYAPDNELDFFGGARYLPAFSYGIPLDSTQLLDFEVSANISASSFFHPFDSITTDADLAPYRIWTRYTGKQFEIRAGLQKIDFGSASLLRPLQWFNQIDPRDPLQLTNGVYALLGRYFFLNNANIWVWGLYGNEQTRGFDAVPTYDVVPEFGARVQYPTPKGEIALSYHHRTANTENLEGIPSFEKIPENRFGLDGKWDLTIGLWFEGSYVHKSRNVGELTNQTLITTGADYTFGIGNGLNVMTEHLFGSFDDEDFNNGSTINVTAFSLSYPLGLWDNLSAFTTYTWSSQDMSFFLNYEHQFKKITSYVMAFYNPTAQLGIQQNELVNNFAGPGLRLMVVYNH
ncbi:MAG: hypothetical protein HC831_06105 [Chloroflexia bacterium]|nr:hypothetical protein [Chloroflexia bacterium]